MKKYNVQNYVRYKQDLEKSIKRIGKKQWQEYTRDIQNLVNRYVDQKEDFYLNSPDTSLQEMATKLGYITK